MHSSSLQPLKPSQLQVVADKLRKCTVCGKLARPGKEPCPCGNDIFTDIYQCRRCRKLLKKAICPDCSAAPAAPTSAGQKVRVSFLSIAGSTWAVGLGFVQWVFMGSWSGLAARKARRTQQALVAKMLPRNLGNPRMCEQIAMIDQRLKSGRESSANARALSRERDGLVHELGVGALATDDLPSYDPEVKVVFRKARAARETNLRWQDRATQSRQALAAAWKQGKVPALIGLSILGLMGLLILGLILLLLTSR